MGDMEIFLTMLGLVFGAVAVFFIYNVFIKDKLLKGKSLAGKVESVLKKDMSSRCARCTFYMNNDYDNGYSQGEWMKLFKERVIDLELDKDSEEYAEAVAPFINAIVIAEEGHYFRRGFEFIEATLTPFSPGYNDSISLNYFVEPYEYVKNEMRRTKSSQPRTTAPSSSYARSTPSRQPEQKKGLSPFEAAELRGAQNRYEAAVNRCKMNAHSSELPTFQAAEKKAFAELMRIQAKYAGRE